MKHALATLAAAVLLLGSATPQAHAEITAEQVRRSIARGVEYLERQQRADGTWPDYAGFTGGTTALCTLALLNSGVAVDDPQIQRALEYLRKLKPERTYVAALQTMVFCAAEPQRDAHLIGQNVKWFESQQIRVGPYKGCWAYGSSQGSGDNSNGQFALLALHEAERVGVATSAQTWGLAKAYWERIQNDDGSWGYLEGHAGSGSMTAAGIAALVMAADKLQPGDAQVIGQNVQCCGAQEDIPAIERGLAWLARNFSVHRNPGGLAGTNWLLYYMYGVERVGRLTNQRFIGGHDWYREGADMLVANQDGLTGYWIGSGHGEDAPHVATSLALLFLSKGRRPVAVAKLKFGPEADWNHHRRDVHNLLEYVQQQWKEAVTWQVVDSENATADDLIQSPVLFMSGSEAVQMSDDQAAELRDFINRGGFVLAEAACGGEAFDESFRALVERMYPEEEYNLGLLPPDHAIWTAEERVPPEYMRPLWGLNVGCRTALVYCPENLGCYWELDRLGRKQTFPAAIEEEVRAVRSIGINVLAYATGRELKEKLDMPLDPGQSTPQDAFDRARLYIAKLRHGGGWDAAPGALSNLLAVVRAEAGVRLSTDRRDVTLDDQALFQYPIVFMHGRNGFELTPAERQQLRIYLERGGMLVADAVCASETFAAAFRREMKAVLPEAPLERIAADDPLFSDAYGGFAIRTLALRDPSRREQGEPLEARIRQTPPELEGARIAERYAVLFSPYDLSCALERHASIECRGYTPEDAARLGLNLILYALH